MDHELMLVWIDCGYSTVIDGEMQPIRGGRSLEKMVRRARMRITQFVLGVRQRANNLCLELGRHLVRGRPVPESKAPWLCRQRFGPGGRRRPAKARPHRSRDHHAAPE